MHHSSIFGRNSSAVFPSAENAWAMMWKNPRRRRLRRRKNLLGHRTTRLSAG
jgi:hypothetical protein